MTELQNFQEVIRFGKPAYVPSGIPDYSIKYHGADHEDFEGHGHHSPVGTEWTDIWGTVWHKDLDGVMGFPKRFPLADLEKLDEFTFVDPDDAKYNYLITDMMKGYDPATKLLGASHRDTLWERAYMLVGMENMMEYFFTEPDLVKRLFQKIIDFHLKLAEHYIAQGVQIVHMSDDHGMQNALILGERILNEFFVPEYARLMRFYKERGVLINFHSCGHIEPILETFMSIGVDILNPLQGAANDVERVRKITQGRMTLMGGVNSEILMENDHDAIRQLVKTRINQLGREGGYVCTPDQGMPYAPEAIEVMREAIATYGRY